MRSSSLDGVFAPNPSGCGPLALPSVLQPLASSDVSTSFCTCVLSTGRCDGCCYENQNSRNLHRSFLQTASPHGKHGAFDRRGASSSSPESRRRASRRVGLVERRGLAEHGLGGAFGGRDRGRRDSAGLATRCAARPPRRPPPSRRTIPPRPCPTRRTSPRSRTRRASPAPRRPAHLHDLGLRRVAARASAEREPEGQRQQRDEPDRARGWRRFGYSRHGVDDGERRLARRGVRHGGHERRAAALERVGERGEGAVHEFGGVGDGDHQPRRRVAHYALPKASAAFAARCRALETSSPGVRPRRRRAWCPRVARARFGVASSAALDDGALVDALAEAERALDALAHEDRRQGRAEPRSSGRAPTSAARRGRRPFRGATRAL